MPYSVLTKDGIKINNIPDNIPSDSDEIRQRVEQARKNRPQTQQPTDQPKILKEGEGSDFLRGIGTYKDQFRGILGGAEVLAGKAVDSDEMIKSGLQRMDESEAAIGRRGVKVTDESPTNWPTNPSLLDANTFPKVFVKDNLLSALKSAMADTPLVVGLPELSNIGKKVGFNVHRSKNKGRQWLPV